MDPNLTTTPAYTLPKKTFTGQYSYMDDPSTQGVAEGFGLMFYNSRFYDPQLGRFAQADTIVPAGLQGLDRYAYLNNSPMMYTDPSGHSPRSNPYWCENARNPGQCRLDYYTWIKVLYDKIEAALASAVKVEFVVVDGFSSKCSAFERHNGCTIPLGGSGLGTVVGNMSTVVTAFHIFDGASRYGPVTYVKITGSDGKTYRFCLAGKKNPMCDGTFIYERIGNSDEMILHLRTALPSESAKPAVANPNYSPSKGDLVVVVYIDNNCKIQFMIGKVRSTSMEGAYGSYYVQIIDRNDVLNRGDSGGGVFVGGELVGIVSAEGAGSALFQLYLAPIWDLPTPFV